MQIWLFVVCVAVAGVAQTDSCVINSLPRFWDFETGNTGGTTQNPIPPCWHSVYTPGPSVITSDDAVSGAKVLKLQGVHDCLLLPPIDTSLFSVSDLQLSFYAFRTGASYLGVNDCQIGVMTNPTDVGTFVVLDTLTSLNNTFQAFDIPLSSYTGNGRYITLRWYGGAGYYHKMYLDDLRLQLIPGCQRPLSLNVTNIQAHSIHLGWDASADSAIYIIHYKAETDTAWCTLTTGILDTAAFTLANLKSGTHYQCYVTATCYPDAASNTVAFTTSCDEIVSLPQVWDFESGLTIESYPQPLCWSRIGQNTSAQMPHVTANSALPAHSGSRILVVDNDEVTYSILPNINTDSLNINDLQISFYVTGYNPAGNDHYELTIGVMSNAANPATFTPVQQIWGYSLDSYHRYTIPLAGYANAGSYIAFRFSGECVLDDITLDFIPACPEPSNLVSDSVTESSVLLSWIGFNAEAGDFTLHYKSVTDTAWITLPFPTASSRYTLSGLLPSTSYEAYLTVNCLPDIPTNLTFFTTDCVPIGKVPQHWNFDYHYVTPHPDLPDCWEKHLTEVALDTTEAGVLRFPIHSDSHIYRPAAALPLINLDSLDIQNLQISFLVRKTSNSAFPAELSVGMTNTSNLWDSVVSIQTISQISGDYQRFDIPLAACSSNANRIVLQYASEEPAFEDFDIEIDDVVLDSVPDCSCPSALSASHPTVHSLTLQWTNYGAHDSLLVYYRETDTPVWFSDTILGNGHTWELNNLNAATIYEIYLSAICDSQQVSNTITASTLCEAITSVPQFWDFEENLTANVMDSPLPECWNRSTYFYPSVFTDTNANSSAYSGNHFLRFLNFGQSTVVLPAIDTNVLSINDLTISFYAKTAVSNDYNHLIVGVMSDPADVTSFIAVDTVGGLLTDYQWFDIPLDSYSGHGGHVAIQVSGSDNSFIDVDDIRLQAIPDCERPSDITLAYVDMTTAELEWSHNADSAWYVVAYKPLDGNSMMYDTTTVMTQPAATITGLSANTTYEVRVAASCYPDVFSEPFIFTTACTIIDSIPLFWDFEQNNTGGTQSKPLPACWQQVPGTSVTSMNSRPGVWDNADYAYSGTKSLNFWQNRGWYVVLPAVADTMQVNGMNLSFFVKVSSQYNTSSSATLAIGVMTDPEDVSTFTAVQTLTGFDTTYQFADIALSAYTGNGKYIAIWDASPIGASGNTDIYIDDLTLGTVPLCPRPLNLTLLNVESRTAELHWSPSTDTTDYLVKYRPVSWDNWQTDTVSGTSHTLSSLIPYTSYEVQVAALCSPETPSVSAYFTTECALDIIAVPQTWGFEEPTDYYNVPLCWLRYLAGASASTPPYVSTYHPLFQNHSLYFFCSSGHIAIMPYVNPDYLDIRALQISFYIYNYRGSENPDATMEVGVMTNPNDPSTFTTIQIIDSIGTDVQFVTVPFYNYTGEGTYIAFRDNNPYPTSVSPNKYYSIYIDNLTIDYCDSLPCAVPTQATVSAITDTSAVVAWNDVQSDPKPYVVYYKPSTDVVWQTDTVFSGAFSHTLQHLHYATAYDCYVAAVCNPETPSNSIHFVTDCYKIKEIPMTWDFEDEGNSGVALPLCWTKVSDTDYPYVSSIGAALNSGNALRFKLDCMAILPVVDRDLVNLSDLTLSFIAKSNNTNNHDVIEIGVIDDPVDTTTFTIIETIDNFTTTFQSFQIPMTLYSGDGSFIAIRHSGGNNTNTLVDDVTLQYTNPIDGISEHPLSTSPVLLYPNPARDYVDIRVTDPDLTILAIEVYDVYGKSVRTVVGANNYSPLQTTRINVSGLVNGAYFVQIHTEKGTITKKMLKAG